MSNKRARKLPLDGIIAFVETLNPDGSDSSEATSSILKSLGAVITESFSDEISHFVCTTASVKRLKAATIFEIAVVNPRWVENCHQSGMRMSEDDFPINQVPSLTAEANRLRTVAPIQPPISADSVVMNNADLKESEVNLEKVKSIVTNSITAKRNVIGNEIKSDKADTKKESKSKSNSRGKLKVTEVDSGLTNDEKNIAHNNENDIDQQNCTSSINIEVIQKVQIPLPSYKELNPIKLPLSMGSNRRSERICDNEESQEDVLDVNKSMPIVRSNSPMLSSFASPRSLVTDEVRNKSKISAADVAGSRAKKPASKAGKSKTKDVRDLDAESSKCVTGDADDGLNSSSSSNNKSTSKETVPDEECGGRMADILGASIVIAVSGFDELGEKATITSSLTDFINSISSPSSSSSSSSSRKSLSGSKVGRGQEPYIVLLGTEEDPFGLHCTHVILQSTSSKRSLRILLALARGTPIVTEEWFYTSLSAQLWVEPKPFMHEHYSAQQLARGLKKPQRIFLRQKFFVGNSSNPTRIFLETVLSACGGSICEDIMSADSLVFGTADDSQEWLDSHTKASKHGPTRAAITAEISRAVDLAKKDKAFTCRYIFDCLEAGEILDPSPQADHHLVTFDTKIKTKEPVGKKRKSSSDNLQVVKESRNSWDTKDVERVDCKKVVEKSKQKKEAKSLGKNTMCDEGEEDEEIFSPSAIAVSSKMVAKKAKIVFGKSSRGESSNAETTVERPISSNEKAGSKNKIKSQAQPNAHPKDEDDGMIPGVGRGNRKVQDPPVCADKDPESTRTRGRYGKSDGEQHLLTESCADKAPSGFGFSVPGSPPVTKRRLSRVRVVADSPPLSLTPPVVDTDRKSSEPKKGPIGADRTTAAEVPKGAAAGVGGKSKPLRKRPFIYEDDEEDDLPVHVDRGYDTLKNIRQKVAKNVGKTASSAARKSNMFQAIADDGGQTEDSPDASSSPKGRADSPCW